MTSVKCQHCDHMTGGPAGLAAHIRAMHPDKVGQPGSPQAREAPPDASSNGLVWEEPPPPRRGNSTVAAIVALIPELRRNPKRWARLYTWRNKTGANGAQSKLRKDEQLSDIEFVARTDTQAGTCALYGRYTGE